MKVLMLVTHPEIGGTETHVLFLAKVLHKHRIQVGVGTCGGPFVPYFNREGVPVHKLIKSRQSSSYGAASSVVSVVKKYGYKVIHAHDTESFRMLPYLRKKLPNVPIVMTVHGMYYSRTELRHAASAANRIIAVSPCVQQWVIQSGIARSKVECIPNGVDVQKFSPDANIIKYRRALGLPEQAKVLLYAGRFQSDKWNIARKLILASEQVARRHPNFITVLVGPGSYRKQLAQLARTVNGRLGRTAIYVLPPTTHMERYYRAATLVVGTGRVALEAMACGKPVIAAGFAGFAGIVTSKGLNRCISNQFGDHAAPKRITISRLDNDIFVLLNNPKLAKGLGNHGRNVVIQRFSIHRVAKMTHHAYTVLLS